MSVTKIVITGGPCGGKTTALQRIKNYFSERGMTVLFVPETATELIDAGITPLTCRNNLAFQCGLMRLQLEKEEVYLTAAEGMRSDRVLLVCDRGALDNKAYMGEEEFQYVLNHIDETEVDLRDSYDAVFHLVTAADGAEAFYNHHTNTARYEDARKAIEVDRKIISAWVGHSHLRVIDNSTGFEEKLDRLIAEISAFVGNPEPLEIERKYLIQYPDLNWLNNNPFCRKVEISQTYLNYPDGRCLRIRKRGSNGEYIYIQTIKKKISDLKRIEIETRLTSEEYDRFLNDSTAEKYTISKDRYCLVYNSQYFELDIFPFWTDRALLEIELIDEQQVIDFPPNVKIIREVTFEDEYKNYTLAKKIANLK